MITTPNPVFLLCTSQAASAFSFRKEDAGGRTPFSLLMIRSRWNCTSCYFLRQGGPASKSWIHSWALINNHNLLTADPTIPKINLHFYFSRSTKPPQRTNQLSSFLVQVAATWMNRVLVQFPPLVVNIVQESFFSKLDMQPCIPIMHE